MLTRVQLTALWRIAKSRLSKAKADESKYRLLLADVLFSGAPLGTSYSEDGAIKLVNKLNYSISKDHNAVLGAMAQVAEEFPDLNLGGVIEFEPRLNVTEYLALPIEARQLLAAVITIKPAMPTMSLANEKETT